MEQCAFEDAQDAEQASVEKAETADAGSMDEDVGTSTRGENSRRAGNGADHSSSFRGVPNTAHLLNEQSYIAIEKLLLISTLPSIGKPSDWSSYHVIRAIL